jgi:phosphoribosylformylglycinamidine (FGAM) synthase PurS component
MPNTYLIEVKHKPGITDPVGKGLASDINELDLARVKSVASAQLYQIHGGLGTEDRTRIARDLLSDPILHDYEISPWDSASRLASAKESRSMVIDVWYKPGVTDVVGESVMKGIKDLNIPGVKEVRTGMRYHLNGVTKAEVAEKIASSLLVNPLVTESIIHAD